MTPMQELQLHLKQKFPHVQKWVWTGSKFEALVRNEKTGELERIKVEHCNG
jgi:hypothetical protein